MVPIPISPEQSRTITCAVGRVLGSWLTAAISVCMYDKVEGTSAPVQLADRLC